MDIIPGQGSGFLRGTQPWMCCRVWSLLRLKDHLIKVMVAQTRQDTGQSSASSAGSQVSSLAAWAAGMSACLPSVCVRSRWHRDCADELP